MKIINNVDDFKSLKSIDLEDIKTTKINDLKRKDEAKTRIMKYITYKKRTEQEVRKKFVCSECGNESPKWLGKCPACNSWNTFYEQKIEKYTEENKIEKKINNTPKPLNTYIGQEANRTSTGYSELDRVLGGGLVKGSLILLGGEPGIGKSTLILQLCEKVQGEGKVLYVSGEESAEQIKLRADRLDVKSEELMFLGETDIDIVK